MAIVAQSRRARADLLRIYEYLYEADPRAADRFLDGVGTALDLIARHPAIGSPRLWRSPALVGVRAWPVPGFPKFILFYRQDRLDRIVLIRVLHGAAMPEGPLRTP